jgi:acetyl-CoA acetyltransferase
MQMSKPAIVGVGMTAFGKYIGSGLRALTHEAVGFALKDSGMTIDEIDMIYFANAAGGLVTGQEMIPGQAAMRGLNVSGIPIVNVENACASGSSAIHLACMAVSSGQYENVLIVGAEKMIHADKAVTFRALAAAVDLEEEANAAHETQVESSGSRFMDIYAGKARKYMHASGATAADLAQVSVKSREAASLNPVAQFRTRVTVDEVLAGRLIAAPLTLLMCAPNSDGAAAIVMTSEANARKRKNHYVRVEASAVVSGIGNPREPNTVRRAAALAFEKAGVGPEDINVVELHDAAAPAELQLYEYIGLCPPGGSVELLRSGATRLGGRVPVNPSGGLLSRGHPLAATGCAQLVELTEQLRGRSGARQCQNPRLGLAQNAGGQQSGDEAVAVVTILSN